jgi:hypothetical protein
MNVQGRILGLVSLGLMAACSSGAPTATPTQRTRPAASLGAGATLYDQAASRGGVITSVDASGLPQFLWAASPRPALPGQTIEQAARWHLTHFAPALQLNAATVERADLVRVHDLGRGGIIAHLHQRVGGIDVYRSDVKVLMGQGHELVAIAGGLKPAALLGSAASARFTLAPADALARALDEVFGTTLTARDVVEVAPSDDGEPRFQLATDQLRLSDAARVKKLFVPMGARLVPAYAVELFAGLPTANDAEAWRLLVSAEDGSILDRRDLTQHDAFNYRVWVDATGRPLDGPQADFTPHPTGMPDGSEPAFIAPTLQAQAGFNHNPLGANDSWLSANAVQSLGNNVDAYTDTNPPDGYSNGDLRATTTAAKTFDRTYDVTLGPTANPNQAMASIIQAFYLTNWMHDWYYDSGFNEAAGDAQTNNFGRGGAGGDVLHVEIQDSYPAQKNNANMSTPADGLSPRMQIYVWSGPETRKLTLTPGGEIPSASASFGPTNFDVTGNVVLMNDGSTGGTAGSAGTGTTSDGCEATPQNLAGAIVLIDRGTCGFTVKVKNAQTAGAAGVLIANNAPSVPPPGMSGTDATITIPTLSITQEAGTALKTSLAAGAVSAELFRHVDIERDGALDNTVVGHEWGHYLHHRLADCGSGQCNAMSEGWADYNALQLVLRDGDNLDGVYPLAIYSSVSMGDAYFGIRRFPYSVDPTKNALSLRHIANGEPLPTTTPGNVFGDNSEVHNAGEIWASMMFEVYVRLQKARGTRTFDDVRRQMADYVVAGLQLTPPDATYTEQRDAILAAISATSAADLRVAAAAFARRGNGTCAIVPDRYSKDFVGVTESRAVKPVVVIGQVKIDDSTRSCDQDGILDADEAGHVTVTVANAGPAPMTSTTLTLSTQTTGITFPSGAQVMIPQLAPFTSTQVLVDVAMDKSVTQAETFNLALQAANADACTTTVQRMVAQAVNVDDVAAVSATDTVESNHPAWTATGTNAGQVWSRVEVTPGDHAWVGADTDGASDTQLVSPDLKVGSTGNFVVKLDHKFSFEKNTNATTMKTTYFDGGVIELSTDGGKTWNDASMWVMPGYGGALDNTANNGNALAGRQAFVATNAGWPMRDTLTLDFGTALAGQTVKLRFRIGTDAGTGDYGWEIDNIAVSGITNTPFSGLVPDMSVCTLKCPAGLTACGDVCTHLPTDVANCGACGNDCSAGSVCAQGQCALSCQAGLTECNGACVNLQSDNTHCGACGMTCPAGQVCSSGTCMLSCQQGLANCNGSCANLQSDNANCGSCGMGCALGSTCIAGSCEQPPAMNPTTPPPSGGCAVAGRAPAPIGPLALLLLTALFTLRLRRRS